jgi:hypothetical protein
MPAEGAEVMTNQQFDAVIKMVLNLFDATSSDPELTRKMIVDLFIDDQIRQEHEKPFQNRDL